MRVDGSAVTVGEHPSVELDAGRVCLGALKRAPRLEDRERGGVEVDRAAGVAGLAARLVHLVADRDEPAVERESLALEVDVVPLESEDLVAAHPRHGGQPEEREVAVSIGGAQELLQFLLGPRPGLGSSGRLDQR